MSWIVAVGGSVMHPVPGRFDFFPLLVIFVALAAVRLMLGIQLRWPVVVGVVTGATLLAGAIEAWGVAIPTGVALAAGAIASAILHRSAGQRA